MRKFLLISLVAISGCAYTPNDVIEHANATEGTSQLGPAALAECLISNTENMSSGYYGRARLANDSGEIEAVLANPARTVGFARIRHAADGSTYKLFMASYMGSEILREQIIKGCVSTWKR